jgi:transposase
MNRHAKYSPDFKKSIVLKVIKGSISTKGVAEEFSIPLQTVKEWLSFYRTHGLDVFSSIRNHYSPDFKYKVIAEMRGNHLSLNETCILFKIPKRSTLKKWLEIYDKEGITGLAIERRGQSRTMPTKPKKPLTKEEQLLEELADLKAENAYLKKLHALVQSEKEKEEKRRSSKN